VTEWVQSHDVPHASEPGSLFTASSSSAFDEARELRRPAPLFFLSYSNATWGGAEGQRGPDRRVIKFFNDLSENVAQLVSRPVGSDPGFMDRSMPGGVHWTDELLVALGRCRSFVALLSDPYLASHWCRMEWHAFSQRKVTRRAGDGETPQVGIIPVIWTPVPDGRLLPAIARIQRFSPRGLPDVDLAAGYEADGVYGLLRMKQEDLYEVLVWRLARCIADFHFSHVVEERRLCVDDVRDPLWRDPL
jgi:TIR domain